MYEEMCCQKPWPRPWTILTWGTPDFRLGIDEDVFKNETVIPTTLFPRNLVFWMYFLDVALMWMIIDLGVRFTISYLVVTTFFSFNYDFEDFVCLFFIFFGWMLVETIFIFKKWAEIQCYVFIKNDKTWQEYEKWVTLSVTRAVSLFE